MVTAITSLGQAFSDLGLSEATIQSEKINHKQVSTLFWINVAIGLTLTLLTAALAPALAYFYHEPRLLSITLALSLTFLIGGLRVQHDAILRRAMLFRAIAFRDVICFMIAVPIAIVMAWRGAGYWALVAMPLTLGFVQMTLSWIMARWLPGLPQRDSSLRSLVGFGGKIAASYLVCNVTRSADSVLIGWHWGAGPLGLYSRAYNLLMLPVRQLGGPARSVAIPAFSRTQHDPELFARYYLRATNILVWLITPVLGFMFVAAEPVILIMLGRHWIESVPVFRLLAISALSQILLESIMWLLVSRGDAARLLVLFVGLAPVTIAGIAIGLPFGIQGVALAASFVLLAVFPWILIVSFKHTRLTLRMFNRALICPIVVGLFSVLSAEVALHISAVSSVIARLAVVGLSFAASYVTALLAAPVRNELAALRQLMVDPKESRLMRNPST